MRKLEENETPEDELKLAIEKLLRWKQELQAKESSSVCNVRLDILLFRILNVMKKFVAYSRYWKLTVKNSIF